MSTKTLSTENDTLTGLWDCGKGTFEVLNRPNTESGYVIEGGCTVTDIETGTDGKVITLAAGDSFVLPKGSSVRFDISDRIQKFYVLSP